MSKVGRYVKATAKPGQAEALAERLLKVAEQLRASPGCELYLINRAPDDPEAVWVTEVWSSQSELDGAPAAADKEQMREVLELTDGEFERIDVTPLGGVGQREAPRTGYTIRNLDDAEDVAAKYGYGETGEARFPSDELEAEQTGVSIHSLRSGKRQQFAHHHHRVEEIYLVLSGSGRVKIEDEILDVGKHDAIRVAPDLTRAFEAGPDGLELLAFGARCRGDAEIVRDWWPD
jgi:mannose-6-phosphate isomerase-like protein (cupin superfamily)/quinol monooxygenase YgiN